MASLAYYILCIAALDRNHTAAMLAADTRLATMFARTARSSAGHALEHRLLETER